MKIALISEWMDPWRGGAERSTLQFTHCLMNLGVDVHVFTRSRPASAPGFTVHSVRGAAMSRTRRSMTFAVRVERMLASSSFDIVHAISPCRAAQVYQPRGGTVAESIERNVALRPGRVGKSWKRCVNRLNLKLRYMLDMEESLLRDPNGPTVIAISDYVVNQLQRHYGLRYPRVRKVFNGVIVDEASDEERLRDRRLIRTEFGIAPNEMLVFTIAHNFRLKGVGRWLEVLRLLRDRGTTDVRSVIVGKDDSLSWHRRARRLGVADRVVFVGPSNRVARFYHAADAVVHPTYYDPCSRVVLEAMTAGTACITTRWDGASEVIEDGCNGYIVDDPADIVGIADRVERLGDRTHRRRMATAAREVQESVSMGRHARDVLAIHTELAAARPVRSN